MKGLKIVVLGRVQGVGFRYFTVKKAQEYYISGSVKNLADGSVHIVAFGTEENLSNFLSEVQKGPSFSHVTDFLVEDLSVLEPPSRFIIEH